MTQRSSFLMDGVVSTVRFRFTFDGVGQEEKGHIYLGHKARKFESLAAGGGCLLLMTVIRFSPPAAPALDLICSRANLSLHPSELL